MSACGQPMGVHALVMQACEVPPPVSFESMYREHARFVWRALRRLGVDRAGIEDAVQDVFIVVAQRLGDRLSQRAEVEYVDVRLRPLVTRRTTQPDAWTAALQEVSQRLVQALDTIFAQLGLAGPARLLSAVDQLFGRLPR